MEQQMQLAFEGLCCHAAEDDEPSASMPQQSARRGRTHQAGSHLLRLPLRRQGFASHVCHTARAHPTRSVGGGSRRFGQGGMGRASRSTSRRHRPPAQRGASQQDAVGHGAPPPRHAAQRPIMAVVGHAAMHVRSQAQPNPTLHPAGHEARGATLAVNCVGLRAAESTARAKRPEWSINKALSRAGRTVWNWNAVLSLSTEQVFATIRAAGQTAALGLRDRQ